MMKTRHFAWLVIAAFVTHGSLVGAETGGVTDWLKISNFLNLEYDDNVYETGTDKQDSVKISESIELGVTLDKDPTYLTLRYRPVFVWWSDREPDDNDVHHNVDAALDHAFSPRVSVNGKNLLRLAEQPEEINRGTVVRENGDYLYNESSLNLDILALSRTHLVLGGRYTLLDYDDEDTSITDDRDIVAAGVTVRHKLTDLSNIIADYRREELSYDNAETADLRDYESDFVGLGFEQMTGDFTGIFRAGYQSTKYTNEDLDDASEPYGDITVTYSFSPRTRFSLGAAYSTLESSVGEFASQNRTIFSASVFHDVTAKISLLLGGSYRLGEYDVDSRVVDNPDAPAEGDEEVTQLYTRASYKLDARNSLELNYSYYDLASDFGDEFDRNRIALGWRLDL